MNSSGGSSNGGGERQKIGNIIFERTGTEIKIADTSDRQQCTLHLSKETSLERTDTDQFMVTTDAAIGVVTDKITLPTVVPIHIRDEYGNQLEKIEHNAYKKLSTDTYCLELFCPIRLYIRVKGSLTLSSDLSQIHIDFGANKDITIGACTNRDKPTTTITTTNDPTDMMAAISTFGSALKTIGPERSYPSYRGHPPLIERDDYLHIPAPLRPPNTGLQIELPPTYQSVYVASPLAYYLGAELVPSHEPRLVADSGFEYRFSTECGLEAEIEKVLKQVFFMDCLLREEGKYSINLHELQMVEPYLDLDFATLYDRPLAEQVEAYLNIPFSLIENHIPKWKLTIHTEAVPASVEMLPFVMNDLALVRIPQQPTTQTTIDESEKAAIQDYLRHTAPTRGTSAQEINTKYVQIEQSDSLEQVWIGDGVPVNANKAIPAAYRNRLTRSPMDDNITIIVICNDASDTASTNNIKIDAEHDLIEEVYGSRADLPFDVTIHYNLSTEELRSVLTTSADFLHYIGHIDDKGINCIDGKLDVRSVDEIGFDAFLLNACRSRKQGEALIECGSIGGIVTISDIINSGAIRMGQTLARLLNGGFPLRAALEIASDETIVSDQYITLGDGGLAIAQSESGTPNLCTIRSTGDQFEIEIEAYPTSQLGMGAAFIPYIESNREFFLNSGTLGKFELSKEELQTFFALENIPVKTKEGLQWSYELDINNL